MKKLWIMLFVIMFWLTLVPFSAMADVINLTLTDQNPQNAWGSTHAQEPWIKKIEEATNGRVKIKPYYSQTLSKGKDAWTAAKDGIADMAWCFHGYWPGMTPMADVINMPGLPIKSAEHGSEILWKLYDEFPEVSDSFKDNKVLILFTSTPFFLITTKKQVKTIDDLKGMKIRTTGGPPTDQMKALGAIPVNIPMPDCYISLQKGVVDGMGASWESASGFRLYEVAKYFTYVQLPCVYFSVVMNKNKWNSLPKDVQAAIMSVSGLEGSKFWGKNFFDSAKDKLFIQIKEANINITEYTLPKTEQKRWQDVGGKPVWDLWVKRMNEKGFSNASEILGAALELCN